eukprot:CAMPEP_0182463962 /NCGR_PEP_ID=MMETSP1319-20130603/8134_1 /TAXON_ID=172717 /ORGANISM="Bolidomonas pacifica, Strain RCC208" /LENGTH=167 /DNA_ID=CAMNT_0024663561 /DNA_START=35 /DNA_END=535 /DNA_ORIENTATION=-
MAEEAQQTAEDFAVNTGSSGASATAPAKASAVRKGGYLVIKGEPCKVENVAISKTGKHGHAKCNFTAKNIFTGQKKTMLQSSTHNVEVPNVTREELQLVDIEDGFLSLMEADGNIRADVALPSEDNVAALAEVGDQIQQYFDEGNGDVIVTIMTAMGQTHAVSVRVE